MHVHQLYHVFPQIKFGQIGVMNTLRNYKTNFHFKIFTFSSVLVYHKALRASLGPLGLITPDRI